MRFVICAVSALSLAACAAAGGYPDSPVDDNVQLSTLAVYFSPAKFAEYQRLTDSGARKALRNEIIYGQVTAHNIKFSQFRIALSRQRNISDATADSAIAIAGGVGAGVASAATKTALLAATSAITGVKGAIDKDLFYEQAMSAMFAQMSANRASVLSQIDKGTVLADADYPLTRGLIDVAAYRDAGSVPGALAGISTDSGVTKENAKSETEDSLIAKAQKPTVVAPQARPGAAAVTSESPTAQ
jgi:zinc transporter ZupT